jgi:hypothetical protein
VLKRLAAFSAALGLLLVVAAPAFATEINQPLPIDSSSFGVDTSGVCHGTPTGSQLDWHFVENQTSTSGQTLTVTFQNAGTFTVSPDQVVDSYVLHFDVYTPGSDVLTAASTTGTDGLLVLSSICSNPPPVVPEAPASALLVLVAGAAALGFVAWRMRRGAAAA